MAAEHRLRPLDGVRALAVLAVLAAHTGLSFLPGGFVGVDVFFVLSGFLITSLLYDQLASTERLGSTGARVVVATEPYNRRGEQTEGSLYPEDDPERVTRWNQLLRMVAAGHPGTGCSTSTTSSVRTAPSPGP